MNSIRLIRSRLIVPALMAALLLPATLLAQLSVTIPPQTWTQDSTGVPGEADDQDRLGLSAAGGDFDNDGYSDLAIGVRREAVGGVLQAGIVLVLPGSSQGSTSSGAMEWAQNSPGIMDQVEADDEFGSVLATGDFNGDGYADLAVGVPMENVEAADNAGAINVIYGSASGLAATGNQFWSQASTNIAGALESGDAFGFSLAAGDFNGDGYDDLAIGAPGDDVQLLSNAGAVNVIYGSMTGLSAEGDQIWTEDTTGVDGDAEAGDLFGFSLAAGDFNDDGYDDLAVGAEGDSGDVAGAGAVYVFFGSAANLTVDGHQRWTQDSPGVLDSSEAEDSFGYALSAADFDGDQYEDLAVGVPLENADAVADSGAVQVLFGSINGLSGVGDESWSQGDAGFPGAPSLSDNLGWVLQSGDFDNDGFADLVFGSPFDDVGDVADAGTVRVLHGRASGLTVGGAQLWTRDDLGATLNDGDSFGTSLASGDFNGDGFVDLAAGAAAENVGAAVGAGTISVLFGNRPEALAEELQRLSRSMRRSLAILERQAGELP